jgi:hypothetical protein
LKADGHVDVEISRNGQTSERGIIDGTVVGGRIAGEAEAGAIACEAIVRTGLADEGAVVRIKPTEAVNVAIVVNS